MSQMLIKIITAVLLLITQSSWAAPQVRIVAAENFYGDIAKQIGGSYVTVRNIMSNPNQDPHLFSSDASVAQAIADADLVIYNGLSYDAWMLNLLGTNQKKAKEVILVGDLIGKKMG